MRMIKQSTHQRPCFSGVARFEQSCWLDATVKLVWFTLSANTNLPDIFQRNAAFRGKLYIRLERIGPALPEIVAGAQHCTPHRAASGRPQPMAPLTPVIRHRVNRIPVKIRTRHVPLAAVAARPQDKSALQRADE